MCPSRRDRREERAFRHLIASSVGEIQPLTRPRRQAPALGGVVGRAESTAYSPDELFADGSAFSNDHAESSKYLRRHCRHVTQRGVSPKTLEALNYLQTDEERNHQ